MANLPDLLQRTHAFAMASLRFYRKIPRIPEAQVTGMQFLRASSAVRLNYRAARRSRSKAEFIAKLGTVVEEADECVAYLEYLHDGEIAADDALYDEARQLCAIFTRSLETARKPAYGQQLTLLSRFQPYFPVSTCEFQLSSSKSSCSAG